MSNESKTKQPTQTRREFLATTGAVAGAAAVSSVAGKAQAAKRNTKRGGTLRFATRSDARGLDPQRNIMYYVSSPLAATTQGLLDLSSDMKPVPGVASEWSSSKDLKTYTFNIRKGVEFHNGRTVDAEAIKWNFERILDPKIGHAFTRSAIKNIEKATAVDKYTLRVDLKKPSGVFAANVTFYPVNLIAPDSADQADSNPIGCGPFKFAKWKRFDRTVMDRFENYFETDADGNNLPYLDRIVGLPKKEDRVRLTALRTGEADLIDNMAYVDAAGFKKKYAGKFQTWDVPQVGTGFVAFNLKKGPFSYANADGMLLRQAAAHAIDHEAIHQAIFYGQGAFATGFYSKASPWHMPGAKKWPEFDPDKSKFLLKKANAMGVKITLVSRQAYAYMHQTGEIVHAMWRDVGFDVSHEIHPNAVLRQKYRANEYDADSSANSYRPDPEAWYSRALHSDAPSNKLRIGWKNEQFDKLIDEAQSTLDFNKRHELYTAAESLVNTDLPMVYTHYVPLIEAGVNSLKGYAPAFAGPFTHSGGGIRSAWLESTA
jgi:peptide/nickel transport system substrate-binding protein